MTTHYPAAIIGAGLGGLMTAVILQRSGIQAPIFELDMSAPAQNQKELLDILHEDSGQRAVRIAGLYEELRKFALPAADATKMILLAALAADAVRWGSKITHIEAPGDGTYFVHLADGTDFTTGLLIGADGAWSKTPTLGSGAESEYMGVPLMDTLSKDAHESREVVELVDFPDTTAANAGLLQTGFLQNFSGWDESLRSLLHDEDASLVPRAVYTIPVGNSQKHIAGITLIGDAAHLTLPFAGENASLATIEGTNLAYQTVP